MSPARRSFPRRPGGLIRRHSVAHITGGRHSRDDFHSLFRCPQIPAVGVETGRPAEEWVSRPAPAGRKEMGSSMIKAVRRAASSLRDLMSSVRSAVLEDDAGMSTAEYAVGTVAAVAFAVVLYKIVNSSAVMNALSKIIRDALSVHL